MNAKNLIFVVGAVFILTLLLRFILQPRVRRISPMRRHKIFAVLLVVGVGAETVALTIAAARGEVGIAIMSFGMALSLGLVCILEMRKLRRNF